MPLNITSGGTFRFSLILSASFLLTRTFRFADYTNPTMRAVEGTSER